MTWAQVAPDATSVEVVPRSAGQSASLLLNQQQGDPGGWRIEIYADYTEVGSVFVASLTVSAALGKHSVRVAGVGSMPGAARWIARVSGPGGAVTIPSLEVAIHCNPGGMVPGFVAVDP